MSTSRSGWHITLSLSLPVSLDVLVCPTLCLPNLNTRTNDSADLRVLGKGDFRHLIKWRLRMVKYRDELKALEGEGNSGDEGEEDQEESAEVPMTEEEKEEEVQAEIRALQ